MANQFTVRLSLITTRSGLFSLLSRRSLQLIT
jgi:hypothetical protein